MPRKTNPSQTLGGLLLPGVLAQRTTRLRFATNVYILPLRHPVEVALLRRLNVSVRTDLVCSSFVPVAAAPACDGWLENEGQKLRRAFPPSSTRALVLHVGGNVGPEYPPYEEFRKNVLDIMEEEVVMKFDKSEGSAEEFYGDASE